MVEQAAVLPGPFGHRTGDMGYTLLDQRRRTLHRTAFCAVQVSKPSVVTLY